MASDTPAPAREPRSEARARELADLLTWQLDDGCGGRDGSLQSALYAWLGEANCTADDADWDVVSLVTGSKDYEQPESATAVYQSGKRLLVALHRAMISHLTSGGTYGVAWEVAHVWIVELLAAQTDLNRAIEQLVLDAARLVPSHG